MSGDTCIFIIIMTSKFHLNRILVIMYATLLSHNLFSKFLSFTIYSNTEPTMTQLLY